LESQRRRHIEIQVEKEGLRDQGIESSAGRGGGRVSNSCTVAGKGKSEGISVLV